mmetsp:Transcript_20659/g.29009  ORF Transcript_20659/g.29009 Transcript_20659/m.29009 type:complete len:184 (-) Transcript_20659:914-1465(-)
MSTTDYKHLEEEEQQLNVEITPAPVEKEFALEAKGGSTALTFVTIGFILTSAFLFMLCVIAAPGWNTIIIFGLFFTVVFLFLMFHGHSSRRWKIKFNSKGLTCPNWHYFGTRTIPWDNVLYVQKPKKHNNMWLFTDTVIVTKNTSLMTHPRILLRQDVVDYLKAMRDIPIMEGDPMPKDLEML